MKTPRKPSPARSQGAVRTPIRHKQRRTLSVSSARSNASGLLSALAQQKKNNASFVVSPLGRRKSILSDNTDIEEPRRKSWWNNLGEHSRDFVELLEENKILEPDNIIEELDMEILSQENKKNYTLELPESSDSESINSIVIPQRKLFTQKENHKQKKFAQIVGPRESLAKLHKTGVDKTLVSGTRELFQNKQRSRPIFPAALLNISPNKTAADKTKEFATAEPKAQVRNIFGNRNTKRKNIFSNFIVSESEDEISEIQPKVFGFQKKIEARRRSSSRGIRESSPASSITTDMEMDDWKMLPSSTMVENQLEVLMTGQTPKRARLSKLTEMESEADTNATKQSNKSSSSKEDKSRKSKTYTKEKTPEIDQEQIIEKDSSNSRKSKTFTKEKTREIDQEAILENYNEITENIYKSRKSKTFTKEIVPQPESDYEIINKSKTLVDDNEDQYKSTKDIEQSRKSKTFIREKTDLEISTSTRRKLQQDDDVENKSKTIISEHNTSMKTRSQSKNTSPNNSQVIEEAHLKSQNTSNKSKTITSPKGTDTTNMQEENPDEPENNDEELNFSLHYENDNEEQETPKVQNESKTSNSMTEKKNLTADSSKLNKSMSNKVIKETADIESSEDKSNSSFKATNRSQDINTSKDIETNHEQEDQYLHTSRNDADTIDNVQVEQKTMNRDVSNVAPDEVDNASDNEDEQEEKNGEQNISENVADEFNDASNNEGEQEESVEQNESEVEPDEIDNASDNEDHDQSLQQTRSEPENKSEEDEDDNEEHQNETDEESETEQNESQEVKDDNEVDQNETHEESETEQNESQEVEDDNEEHQNEIHNESETEHNEINVQNESDTEQNESQMQNESDLEQNESQVQNESDLQEDASEVEHNESQEVDEEDEELDIDAENNESSVQNEEQNESEHENEEESEAIIESGDENQNNPNNSQDNGNDIENQEENTQDETIEPSNVSHDTTGRNRKKNKSPEAVLHDSRNLNNSYYLLKGDKSVRKTEMLKSLHRDLIPARESTGFSDGSTNSSAQGSGWDSHRTTRKTLRQTYGREITPRKSLRALVMEKSARRQTQHNEIASITAPFPQANSTEMPSTRFNDDNDDDDIENRSPNETSFRTQQATLEKYLMDVQRKNEETRQKIEEEVRNSLNAPPKLHIFKVPAKPLFARKAAPKPKKSNSQSDTKVTQLFGYLPAEFLEDMKYKPPKRFQPRDAPWITKHLYKFLEAKLEPKYHYKSRVRAEKLVENMYNFSKDLRRRGVASSDSVEVLKREMARLDIVKTHFEFYEFIKEYMPLEVRLKVVPDIVNNISLPRHGIFADIL